MYVDGFVVPVKRDRLEDYRKIAAEMSSVWLRNGALQFVETVADDVPDGKVTSFPLAVKLEPDEVVVFSWITYPDRETRDRVNAAVMQAEMPEILKTDPPMNMQRMFWGGFRAIVNETGGTV